jgi:hypothetical protein
MLGYNNIIEFHYAFKMTTSLDLCSSESQVLIVKEVISVEIHRYVCIIGNGGHFFQEQ